MKGRRSKVLLIDIEILSNEDKKEMEKEFKKNGMLSDGSPLITKDTIETLRKLSRKEFIELVRSLQSVYFIQKGIN